MSIQPRRIRLKPWLIAQVNSGKYPGLQWLDKEQKLFQIPWRHATRHMPTLEEENTIFKAWALETGKYQEGVDEPDPAKWKANLRCALNKSREFRLKYDGTKETPVEPYKIYEVCDQPYNGDPPSYSAIPFINNTFGSSSLPQMGLLHNSITPNPNGGVAIDVPHQTMTLPEFHNDISLDLRHGGFIHGNGAAGPGDMGHGSIPRGHSEMPPTPISADIADAPMTAVINPQGDVQPQPCIYDLLISPHMLPLTDLDLKFQYRGRAAGCLTVSNPQGCRLYYGNLEPTPEQVDLFGPVTLQQVLFPNTMEIPNEKQRYYTNQLLDVMDRGLILEIQGQDIYAIRLCQCKVYWSGPGVLEQAGPNPIEREKKIKVFSLNNFLQGLILYQKGENNAPPPFEIYFCFGEDWPDRKPKEKKLIIVQVIPVVARILTEMFSGELSWSTDSIRLQISNPDLKDQTVEQFKELHRLWQNQQTQAQWGLQPSNLT
ncbi:IRF5 factor, partial [Amia calva]|nr:IRF5 factor [Amia calva]